MKLNFERALLNRIPLHDGGLLLFAIAGEL
jgi:hypothetical protein